MNTLDSLCDLPTVTIPANWRVWPTHWAGGSNGVQVDGHNTIWIDSDGGEICRLRTDRGRVTDETYARAHLICRAVNSHYEMLEALQQTVGFLVRQHGTLCDEMKTMRNADKFLAAKGRVERMAETLRNAELAISKAKGGAK